MNLILHTQHLSTYTLVSYLPTGVILSNSRGMVQLTFAELESLVKKLT